MKNNWQTRKLGEISEYIGRGVSPKYVNAGGIIVLNQKCIREHKINYDEARRHDIASREVTSEKLIQLGDVLVNSTGVGTLGRVAQVKKLPTDDATVDSHVTIVRPIKGIFDSNFFGYAMIYVEDLLKELGEGASGQIELSRLKLKEGFIITFSKDLNEQKIIVKKLDDVFEKIEKAKGNIEKNLQNSQDLFDSHLIEIFSDSKEWDEEILKKITTKIGSGATPRGGKKDYKDIGIPLIRSLNVYDREFRKKNLAFLDKNQADKLSNVIVEKGDVLLNITGASVARCYIVPDEILPARVNQHVSIIRLIKEIVLPQFIHYELISKIYKDKLLSTGEKGGATRQAITKVQLENFFVKYPKSLKIQGDIVKKLNELSGQTKKLEEIYKQKLADLEELKKSVLAEAFAGRL